MRYVFFLSSFLALCLPSPSLAGWDNGDCGPVGSPVQAEQGYRWERSASDADCYGLRLNGIQVGAWRVSTNEYRQLIGNTWGPLCRPPINVPGAQALKRSDCPCCGENCQCAVRPCDKPDCKCVLQVKHFAGAVVEKDGTLNFGLTRPAEPRPAKRIHNGREVSKEQIFAALGKASLADDSGQLALTVIGPDAERQRVLSDLESAAPLAAFKGKVKVQGYTPDHWAVKDAGFVTTGTPTIYCQAPDGKVFHRQDSYAGPEALAEALRKASDSYNAAKDPNLNQSEIERLFSDAKQQIETVPAWVWLALALVVYLRFFHKEPTP